MTYIPAGAISILSSNNSTSTPLNDGQTWTGTSERPNTQACMFSIETDQTGTYKIEISQDNSNFTTIGSYEYRTGGLDRPHVFQLGNRYIRLSFTNDSGSNQTYLRIQTYFGQFNQLTAPLNGTIVRDADSILVRTINEPIEVKRGKFDGISVVGKHGYNPTITTSTDPEDIWNGGGDYTGFNPTSGEAIEFLSSSAQDAGTVLSSGTATGGSTTTLIDTGATFSTDTVAVGDLVINDTKSLHGFVTAVTETTLTVYHWSDGEKDFEDTSFESGDSYRVVTNNGTGACTARARDAKDSNYTESAFYVVLNGTTPVDSSGTDFIRLTSFQLIGAGSNNSAVGTITARQTTTTANVFGVVPIGANRTLVGAYTIPAGKKGYMVEAGVDIVRTNGSATSGSGSLLARLPGGVFASRRFFTLSSSFSYQPIMSNAPVEFGEKSDIKMRIESVSDNTVSAATDFSIILKSN